MAETGRIEEGGWSAVHGFWHGSGCIRLRGRVVVRGEQRALAILRFWNLVILVAMIASRWRIGRFETLSS